jgi:hypothetical protein
LRISRGNAPWYIRTELHGIGDDIAVWFRSKPKLSKQILAPVSCRGPMKQHAKAHWVACLKLD